MDSENRLAALVGRKEANKNLGTKDLKRKYAGVPAEFEREWEFIRFTRRLENGNDPRRGAPRPL